MKRFLRSVAYPVWLGCGMAAFAAAPAEAE